jgi:hypothetical protein
MLCARPKSVAFVVLDYFSKLSREARQELVCVAAALHSDKHTLDAS